MSGNRPKGGLPLSGQENRDGKRKETGGGDYLHGRGFRPVVYGRGKEGGADGLLLREGLHDFQAQRVRDLGEYPEAAGRAVQGSGCGECVSAPVYPREPSAEGEGPCGGIRPECAWVTYGGSEKLEERYCIRPTSETLFCEHYKNIIHSHRDLPKLYNQWCSVLRWEKTSRPFLRHREFLWQEGHTMHATAEEAREETMQMLNIYADFMENVLAMPVVKAARPTRRSSTARGDLHRGVHDARPEGLQAGTSHYFGDGFARAFDITFTGKDNQLPPPHQTSWGVSTRMIGGIIMTHGDNNGLVLPPRIAPIQAMVIPVAQHKEGVLEAASALLDRLKPPASGPVWTTPTSPWAGRPPSTR